MSKSRKSVTCILAAALTATAIPASVGLLPGTASEANAQSYSCYRTFYTSGVEMDVCNNTSGKSGVYLVRNTSNVDRYVCWTLVFRDGSEQQGCKITLRARTEERSSCYSCNTQHRGGVVNVVWRKNETK